jgi:hypothetical protein
MIVRFSMSPRTPFDGAELLELLELLEEDDPPGQICVDGIVGGGQAPEYGCSGERSWPRVMS